MLWWRGIVPAQARRRANRPMRKRSFQKGVTTKGLGGAWDPFSKVGEQKTKKPGRCLPGSLRYAYLSWQARQTALAALEKRRKVLVSLRWGSWQLAHSTDGPVMLAGAPKARV